MEKGLGRGGKTLFPLPSFGSVPAALQIILQKTLVEEKHTNFT